MITKIVMTAIVLFLGYLLIGKTKVATNTEHFFDIENTNAMRGFWCIVIVLVHIPVAYTNVIQDMIGSFAYIGVTFFFMTSAYGVKLSVTKGGGDLSNFWKKRLPKLFIPMLLVNITQIIIMYFFSFEIYPKLLIQVNKWIWWLFFCYLVFWSVYKYIKIQHRDLLIAIVIIAFSLIMFFLRHGGQFLWITEIYGFVWGLLLANKKEKFLYYMTHNWKINVIVALILSACLGMCYLKYKYVFFFGEYFLKIVLGFCILWFILILNVRFVLSNRISLFLGAISYEIYLVHVALNRVYEVIFVNKESGVYIFILLISTVAISYLLHLFYNLFWEKRKKKIDER